jgi:hypothetical protein
MYLQVHFISFFQSIQTNGTGSQMELFMLTEKQRDGDDDNDYGDDNFFYHLVKFATG